MLQHVLIFAGHILVKAHVTKLFIFYFPINVCIDTVLAMLAYMTCGSYVSRVSTRSLQIYYKGKQKWSAHFAITCNSDPKLVMSSIVSPNSNVCTRYILHLFFLEKYRNTVRLVGYNEKFSLCKFFLDKTCICHYYWVRGFV